MSGNDLVDGNVAKKARLRALGGFFSKRGQEESCDIIWREIKLYIVRQVIISMHN